MKKFLALALACMTMTVTAFASGGTDTTGATGMDAVLGSMTTITSLLNWIWELMTGNPLLALYLAVSLLGVGVTVFWRIKRASRS